MSSMYQRHLGLYESLDHLVDYDLNVSNLIDNQTFMLSFAWRFGAFCFDIFFLFTQKLVWCTFPCQEKTILIKFMIGNFFVSVYTLNNTQLIEYSIMQKIKKLVNLIYYQYRLKHVL